jgi:hypothetical protein
VAVGGIALQNLLVALQRLLLVADLVQQLPQCENEVLIIIFCSVFFFSGLVQFKGSHFLTAR